MLIVSNRIHIYSLCHDEIVNSVERAHIVTLFMGYGDAETKTDLKKLKETLKH